MDAAEGNQTGEPGEIAVRGEVLRRARFLEEFKEVDEVRELIGSLDSIYRDPIAVERCVERYLYIIDQYQEQPHLLNPHLESLLGQLLGIVRNVEQPPEVVHLAFKLLYMLTKTRGYKVIVRMMPHEVADLEPLLAMLEKQKPTDSQSWETRYMLFLWLSIVCMIPFDMSRLDGHVVVTTGGGSGGKKPVMDRILDVAMVYVGVTDKSRDAAAYMVSRFLTRPDVRRDRFDAFLAVILDRIKVIDVETRVGMFAMAGVLTLLSSLFKHGKREDLIHCDTQILEAVTQRRLVVCSNTLLRKLHIKLTQRIGLNFLRAKLAMWRYQRGSRVLADNVSSTTIPTVSAVNASSTGRFKEQKEEEEESYEIPDQVEEIIEKAPRLFKRIMCAFAEALLLGLKDKDTVVRWSAAKGIGRVTGRLPRELADDVVGSVMDIFSPVNSDSAWHGGCLSLAELGRRGLLLPQRLPEVVPVIVRALNYDERHGTSSVGGNVRDAACYVCWAFARAYDVEEIRPHVNRIATALVIVSLFDRQVNVRRAAAAAFQEHVGRQGQFPHGIDILTMCDYFAVGSSNNCYLQLSVAVAEYPEYTLPLVEHLVHIKICHWDIGLRELAAGSLHLLTAKAPDYMATEALPTLLKLCLNMDFNSHHGALLGVAHITHALATHAQRQSRPVTDVIAAEDVQALLSLTQKIMDANFFKGSNGEPMKKAVCCFIEKLSMSHLPYHQSPGLVELWQGLINDCLQQVEPEIQAAAILAIPAFCTEHYRLTDGSAAPSNRAESRRALLTQACSLAASGAAPGCYSRYRVARVVHALVERYIKELLSPLEPTRCGFALALGALPAFMLPADRIGTEGTGTNGTGPGPLGPLGTVLDALMSATAIDPKHRAYAEARRDAVKALASVCLTVGIRAPHTPPTGGGAHNSMEGVSGGEVARVYTALLRAMRDYTLDSRGDVGALVREAAMTGLCQLAGMLVTSTRPQLFTPDMCTQLMCSLVQQACEKIDRTRQQAGTLFAAMLYHSPELLHIPHRSELVALFPSADIGGINWAAPGVTFPLLTQLLALPAYTYSVLLGLTVSSGGITESLVKHAASCLLSYLHDAQPAPPRVAHFAAILLRIFSDHQKVDRVTLPMFRMLDRLLTSGALACLTACTPADVVGGGAKGGTEGTAGVAVEGADAKDGLGAFVTALCALCKTEVSKCGDVQKLLASIDVFCGLTQFEGAVKQRALQQLMVFLCHAFPIVRKGAASKLYEASVMYAGVVEDSVADQVTALLTDTLWDQPLDVIRPIRNELCDLLKVQRPVPIVFSELFEPWRN